MDRAGAVTLPPRKPESLQRPRIYGAGDPGRTVYGPLAGRVLPDTDFRPDRRQPHRISSRAGVWAPFCRDRVEYRSDGAERVAWRDRPGGGPR